MIRVLVAVLLLALALGGPIDSRRFGLHRATLSGEQAWMPKVRLVLNPTGRDERQMQAILIDGEMRLALFAGSPFVTAGF